MEAKHTTGPWEVDATARDYMNQLIVMGKCPDQGRKVVANVAVNGKGNKTSFTPEQLANANLIALLPELLGALTTLTNMAEAFPSELHKDHPDVVAARAIIAKATA